MNTAESRRIQVRLLPGVYPLLYFLWAIYRGWALQKWWPLWCWVTVAPVAALSLAFVIVLALASRDFTGARYREASTEYRRPFGIAAALQIAGLICGPLLFRSVGVVSVLFFGSVAYWLPAMQLFIARQNPTVAERRALALAPAAWFAVCYLFDISFRT
jgi:hypothetical protein